MGRKLDERRAEPRLRAQTFASLRNCEQHADQAFCMVQDVSVGGMRLRTPQPPRLGTRVSVRVAIGEQLFSFSAQVVRVVPGEGADAEVGLQFDPDSPNAHAFLIAFVNGGFCL